MSATADQELAELRRANAKLLKERDAALAEAQACSAALSRRNSEHGEQIEQQAATIEVLKAMSASPGNPQPVFDLIVERARTCCSAELAALTLLDGDLLRLEATSSMTAARAEQFAKAYPLHVSQAFAGGRAILLRETVQVPDTKLDPGFAHRGTNDWHRSVLAVPLLRTGTPIGAIGLGRPTAGTFSQAQVELLKTFAEQAVIAITSAETYHELQERTAALARRNDEFGERIEHQSATIEVLKAMSASPGDKKPIFDLIVRRAVDLCSAQSGGLFEYDGNLVSIGTIHGLFEHNGELVHVETLQGNEQDIEPSALRSYLRQFPMAPSRGSVSMRAILDNRLLHIRDMRAEDLIDDVRRLGHRSQVSVPLRQSGRAIGVITMAANEPGGFSDSQVALLQTFAEQAVIAITSAETYRALQTRTADLQESLDYQTATSDVLKVISGSGFALEPVFKTVVDTAARLCHADQAMIFRLEDDAFLWAAGTDMVVPEHGRRVRSFPIRPGTGTLIGRVALQGRPVQILDGQTDPLLDPEVKESGRIGGVHTSLGVPLVRDGVIIGAIGLARRRIEPFTDQQIELVSTFADQAVIAIENTRLLTEQQEALEQQTATAEVLQVINASPGDLAPVFDAMLDKALRLCGAAFGALRTFDGDVLHTVASRNLPPRFAEYWNKPVRPNSAIAAAVFERRIVHVEDTTAGGYYRAGGPIAVAGGRTRRCSHRRPCSPDQRRNHAGHLDRLSPGDEALLRQRAWVTAELRRAGGGRNGERAAVGGNPCCARRCRGGIS